MITPRMNKCFYCLKSAAVQMENDDKITSSILLTIYGRACVHEIVQLSSKASLL